MKQSAGILLYRKINPEPEYFLVHPGGPYFVKKHEGWWTIPKGEPRDGEPLLSAAIREFQEETGFAPPGPYQELAPVIQKGGKKVHAWACEGNPNEKNIISNTFEIEWPPRSGKLKTFPEIDKAGWFTAGEALLLINESQASFIHQLRLLFG
ncbi:NUDIX hydrolase [Flavobacterium cyanobacteriorum]|uniref:NUDIX hydrolase n=1 Tax=Flavobacterium cyanobacteriorum TaxID=2022802 RepID=A0A255Z8H6_9FLAO|nr:NUDIX domain-containing protein [Flavobacterium cyanobacteriorum]OYQ37749.1 NUDIX hydrolase [Flavobacterium cyanobacteriorum]